MHLKKDKKTPEKQIVPHNNTYLLDCYSIFIDYNILTLSPIFINRRKISLLYKAEGTENELVTGTVTSMER